MRILPGILIVFALLCSCGKAVQSDSSPQEEGVELARNYSPEKAAHKLIDWLLSADSTQRDFSQDLSSSILMYYDTIGSQDSARRFVSAFDSIVARLSATKRARILLSMNSPAKIAVLLARREPDEALVKEIEKQLRGDNLLLEEFSTTFEAVQKRFKRIDNENSESLRSDD
ncbi:MAG: hypothetical protein K2G09_10175 [Paramuribaculum sp.]|nr:hypothetical protein [Paramuribaculum sp.]